MVSVCVPVYNGMKYVGEQLGSILCQLGEGDEVVVSDDGSTDGTLEYVRALSAEDPRVRVVEHAKEPSSHAFDYTTRNVEHAILHSRGDVIFLADQDDVWMPGKVSLFLEELKGSDLVLSDCVVVDGGMGVLSNSYFRLNGSAPGILRNLVGNSYLGCCMAFRRTLLRYALPFPRTLVPHDIWLGLLAEARGRVSFLRTPTMYYRRHSGNLSSSGGTSANSLAFKLYYRLAVAFSLIKRLYVE